MLVWLPILSHAYCTPNEELVFCQNQIRDIADTIEFSMIQNPDWESIFVIDGVNVYNTLNKLADRLEERVAECPCIGTCTDYDFCTAPQVHG